MARPRPPWGHVRCARQHQRRTPELHDVYQARIDDVIAWAQTMKEPADMAALRAELDGVLDDLEATLEDSEYIVGEAYSPADVMATVLVARLRLMKPVSGLDERPKLVAHYLRMRERPAFPARDVAESIDAGLMFRMMAPFFLPRAAAVLLLCGAASLGLWWWATAS